MTPRQPPYHRCDRCGEPCLVLSTSSPWEFTWRCACEQAGVISWAHAEEPPTFEADVILSFEPEP